MQTNWKTTTKQTNKCNAFPMVWAAIFGCKGEKTGTWRYTIGHFGRRDVAWACPTCRAAKDRLEAVGRAEHQRMLIEAQAAAGVEDYRTAEVEMVKGVPTIIR